MPPSDDTPEGRAPAGDRVLAGVVRRAGAWVVPLVVLGVAGTAATLALPAVLGRAVDDVVASSRDGSPPPGGALALAAALVGFLVVEDAVKQVVSGSGIARSTGDLRRRLARHVVAAGPGLTRHAAEGDLVARLVANTATAARTVGLVAGLAWAVLPPVGGVVALALLDPWLAVTFVAGMAVATGAVRTYLRDARIANVGYQEAQGQLAGRLVDALAGARTIAAARTSDREEARVLEPLPALHRHGVMTWHTMARLAAQGEPAVLLTQVAVVAVAGARLAGGHLSAGELLAASRYAVMAAGIGALVGQLSGLARARAAGQRLAEVLAAPVLSHGTRRLPPGTGRLELRGVSAGPAGAPVLDGLDLVVPGGWVVVLVGRSGAGKSTLAAVAGRLADPSAGSVLLDGVPLDELDRRELRRAVAYAFERPHLLGRTVAGAVALGPARPAPGRLRAAVRAARADGFVARLPQGPATPLAETPLSGGEAQRLGLARAMVRDARLLVLDDATSSLDTATEAQVTAALTDRSAGRTRLVVSHRLATAARADAVAWLDGGRIRAFGPHHVLWADPAYRAIFTAPPPTAGPQAVPASAPAATDRVGGSGTAEPVPVPAAAGWAAEQGVLGPTRPTAGVAPAVEGRGLSMAERDAATPPGSPAVTGAGDALGATPTAAPAASGSPHR